MERFGFKNFKKFKDFPMIDLAPITLIVGPNNSGKSSFIKALTFLYSNLANQPKTSKLYPPFMKEVSFYQPSVANYGWGDFTTSLYRGSENNSISFEWEIRGVRFSFSFGATPSEIQLSSSLKATLPISKFCVESAKLGFAITNVLRSNTWDTTVQIKLDALMDWLTLSIKWLKGRVERVPYKVLNKIPILRDLESWDRSINRHFNDRIDRQYALYKEALGVASNDQDKTIEFDYSSPANDPISKALHDYCDYCINLISGHRLGKALIAPDFEYIEAHDAPHTHAIRANDKNSFLARTITEFYSQVPHIPENNNLYAWVNGWMKKFGIGDFFEINTQFGGEILTVGIGKNSELTNYTFGNIPVPSLASLGTGAIQLFVLLIKIATVLKRIGEDGFVTIIVEEPEQNLHPALQSKLADLFNDVYALTEGRVRFLIETHSEYLIRRTQVIVAELAKDKHIADIEDLEEQNPFKVYYFPEEGNPYDMIYRPDGRFYEEFGTGFFNVASNLAISLF